MIGAADAGVSGVDQYFVRLNLRSVQFLDLELLDASQNQSLHDCSFLTESVLLLPADPLRDISHYTLFQKVLQIAFCKVLYKACRAYFQGFRIIETATRDNNRP